MRLLNVNSSHLPPTLRRGAAAASLGAAQGVGAAGTGGGSGGGAAGAGGGPAGGGGGGAGRGGRSSAAQGSLKRENLRVRNLLVRGKACRSEMGVAQKNINFGKIAVRACVHYLRARVICVRGTDRGGSFGGLE